MPTGTLQFWYEFASTYSYPAVCRVERLAQQAGVALKWKPFLLGPIFRLQGWEDSPFNLFAAKGRYMWRDLERLCQAEGLPFRRPTQFPRNGLLAARVACLGAAESWCPAFTKGVFRANFAEDRDIADPTALVELLVSCGQDGAALIERARAAENKARLRQQTDEALALGIFGAPTFVVGRELFWGNDRLEQALAWCTRLP
jgi:2-hydroxychromene-2-carboxylate isomerase